jgi:hypothetical protein
MIDPHDFTICEICKWYDENNAQCYDGHLQYNKKTECEGYEPFDKKEVDDG